MRKVLLYFALKYQGDYKKILSAIEEKELSKAIERYITLNGGNKIQVLQDLYTKYQNSYIFPTVLYKLAEASSSVRSLKLYEHIVNTHKPLAKNPVF